MKRPAALVAYRALSDVAAKGAFLVVTVAAARRLSGDAFGIFSLGSTIGWMAAIAADFGVQLHLARAVAQNPAGAERLLSVWLRLRLWTTTAVLAAVAIILVATGAGAPYTAALLILSVAYGVNGLTEFLHYFYRGLSRSDIESTLTLAQRGATLGIALSALWWRPDVTVLALALAVPSVLTFLYSVRLATRLSRDVGPQLAQGSASLRLGLEFRRSVMPIGVGMVLSALYFRIDLFLVQSWQGTTAVGLYNAMFRLVEALRLFPAAALAVTLPSLCRATSARPLLNVSAVVVVFSGAATVVLWLMAGWLVPFLYGPRYADAVPVLRVLLLSFPLMSFNYALTHQLVGWNGHRAYAAICGAALLFNVVLNMRLIPTWSIVGAAWSTLLTEVVLTTGCLAALWMGGLRPAGSAPLIVTADL